MGSPRPYQRDHVYPGRFPSSPPRGGDRRPLSSAARCSCSCACLLVDVVLEGWLVTLFGSRHDINGVGVVDAATWPKTVKTVLYFVLAVLTAAKLTVDRGWGRLRTRADLALLVLAAVLLLAGIFGPSEPKLIGEGAVRLLPRGARLLRAAGPQPRAGPDPPDPLAAGRPGGHRGPGRAGAVGGRATGVRGGGLGRPHLGQHQPRPGPHGPPQRPRPPHRAGAARPVRGVRRAGEGGPVVVGGGRGDGARHGRVPVARVDRGRPGRPARDRRAAPGPLAALRAAGPAGPHHRRDPDLLEGHPGRVAAPVRRRHRRRADPQRQGVRRPGRAAVVRHGRPRDPAALLPAGREAAGPPAAARLRRRPVRRHRRVPERPELERGPALPAGRLRQVRLRGQDRGRVLAAPGGRDRAARADRLPGLAVVPGRADGAGTATASRGAGAGPRTRTSGPVLGPGGDPVRDPHRIAFGLVGGSAGSAVTVHDRGHRLGGARARRPRWHRRRAGTRPRSHRATEQ